MREGCLKSDDIKVVHCRPDMNFSTEPTPCAMKAELDKFCPGFEAEKQAILDVLERKGVSSQNLQLRIIREALFSQSITAFLEQHEIFAKDAPLFWTDRLSHCVLAQKGKVKPVGVQFQDRVWLRKASNALGLVYKDEKPHRNYRFSQSAEKLVTVCVPHGWIFNPHRPVQHIEVCKGCDKTIRIDGSRYGNVHGPMQLCRKCSSRTTFQAVAHTIEMHYKQYY